MEQHEILNAIAVLKDVIDPLARAGKGTAVDTVTEKILELVEKIKE